MKMIYILILSALLFVSCAPREPNVIWESALVGTRMPDSIRHYFDIQKDTIQKLYKSRLYINPELQGNFILRFMVMKSGEIDYVFLDSCRLEDDLLQSQIRLAVQDWLFPPSNEDSIEVIVPIYLLQEE